jgi:hypothetical protein
MLGTDEHERLLAGGRVAEAAPGSIMLGIDGHERLPGAAGAFAKSEGWVDEIQIARGAGFRQASWTTKRQGRHSGAERIAVRPRFHYSPVACGGRRALFEERSSRRRGRPGRDPEVEERSTWLR